MNNANTILEIKVIYEDEHIIAIDKPTGMLSVPGRGIEKQDSAQSRIAQIYPGAVAIHRLDMCTSGIMLLAKHKDAERHYKQQFEQRKVEKHYLAIVHGCPTPSSGNLDFPLIVDWPNRPRQKVCYEQGKNALTFYRVIESQGQYSRIALTPHTGRSHQLRVHLSTIGHPILGDNLYGYESDKTSSIRLHLHACELKIISVKNQTIHLHCPAPF